MCFCIIANALTVDNSTLNQSCLMVNFNEVCSEDISTFTVIFQQGFGDCQELLEFHTTKNNSQITQHVFQLIVFQLEIYATVLLLCIMEILYQLTLTSMQLLAP